MSIWCYFLIAVCGLVWFIAAYLEYNSYKSAKRQGRTWYCDWSKVLKTVFAPVYVVWGIVYVVGMEIYDYVGTLREHGGYRGYKEWKKQKAAEEQRWAAERKAEQEEYKRIKAAYRKGEISRTDLPRAEDGETCFEFVPEMGLYVDYHSDVRGLVYVESEYNERLNRFFKEHRDLRLYHMYPFVYLPNFCKELMDEELLRYLHPDIETDEKVGLTLPSTYPMQYLAYAEDAAKIKQGMFFFRGRCDNHGAEYIRGDYYPLHEGSDDEIIAQLDAIVRSVHERHGNGGLHCQVERPTAEEGSSEEYADDQFLWVLADDKVAGLVKEVRERIAKLKDLGLDEHTLLRLLKKKPQLSRLVITKDMRIVLPDYNDMEIKMEPINKAVYLLFLRHPEGIIFKHLPDYRRELAEIYQKIKPLGLNERALHSIEDVTNPCLNSINEKCARIRGAFTSMIDGELASHYYVYGWRGEAKKVSLPRNMVVWE